MTTPANLIFIQSDNHNRNVTGCYGHAIVKTPTLDKLAARGDGDRPQRAPDRILGQCDRL
jgi:hypothetical protein